MAVENDTIYIDIDDEITGIIDKLKVSKAKVVTLVLPKRAAVFQSSVNMKLLKRAADGEKKQAILVTSEVGLLPLAGAAGLYVAKSLSSKPSIPAPPNLDGTSEESVSEAGQALGEPAINPKKSIAVLSGEDENAAPPLPIDTAGVETIALADEEAKTEEAAATEPRSFDPPKKKNKKLKIPNFERFRLLLALLVLIIIIAVIAFLFLNSSLAKATINIKTNASNVSVNENLNLSTGATTLAPDGSSVPAKLEQLQKTYTQQVPTTGQKNDGNPAAGSITISGEECYPNLGQPPTLPAGSGVSANGQTYITQNDTVFSPLGQSPSGPGHGSCQVYNSDADTPITAQNGGASGNTPDGTPFTVAGRSDLTGSGGASGGTDDVVQSVNQNDINSAKAKISTNNNAAQQTLDTQIKAAGYYPLDATFNPGTPNVTSSAQVGAEASTVTVTEAITYTEFAVHQSDLQTLLDSNISAQIDTSKQSILDDGLSNATFNLVSQTSSAASLTLSTKAEVGPQLNASNIEQSAENQKAGAIQSQLSNIPGVTSVSVKFSPFWVDTAPSKASKIKVVIAKPTS